MNDTSDNGMRPARRRFLKSVFAASLAPVVLPTGVLGARAPSKKVTLGFIGVGGHGTAMNLKSFLAQDDCRALAVCDAYRSKAEAAKLLVDEQYGDKGCRIAEDFREIIDDESIDAVVISTPDHWHVPMSLMALAKGKHVFCEKPTLCIAEGRELADAVQASGKVFQTGLEDRALTHYHRLVELERNGAIGDLYHVDVVLPPGSINPASPEVPVPEDLDWEMWLGPAPWHPYTVTRTMPMHWRYIRDYSTGILTDWGTHLVDTAQLAVNDPAVCPVQVMAWGLPVPEGNESDIPAYYDVQYRYGNGRTLRVRDGGEEEWLGQSASIRLLGSRGWVAVNGWRGQFAASEPAILRTKVDPHTSKFRSRPELEQRNFLDCIATGEETTYPAETLHLLSTTLHMGLIAMDLGRRLRWDVQNEAFIADIEANRLRFRKRRDDWKKR